MIKNQGFTLIELMLSLALGLIISAAAILLFLTSQKSLSMQLGVSDVQDNANFGLNYLTQDIRLANLNNPKAVINDQTAYGGIVLTSAINSAKDAANEPLSNLYKTIVGVTANTNLLSRSNGDSVGSGNAWTGASNTQSNGSDITSDQLVIQYIPQYIVDTKGTTTQNDDEYKGGIDCEGNNLNFPLASGRQVVVQRYFLRKDAKNNIDEPNQPLALACDAGYYSLTGNPTAITRYGDAGEIVMKRVDYLRVLLNVQGGTGRRYISIHDYLNLTAPRPRIVSVQIGLLTRSLQPVSAEVAIKDDQQFSVLDQTITVKKPENSTKKYVRQVISQTIALRNVIGERGE
ncbi:PilW family protein [Acinetobacter sp. LMB-5]|uniref:PilW family protein n=1 Tax=Acinetobacter sp. LMB-5 TaxID=1609919 RepID=UPI000760B8BE|nr:PilW family protein [Acinetobacter sp. LMB-5]